MHLIPIRFNLLSHTQPSHQPFAFPFPFSPNRPPAKKKKKKYCPGGGGGEETARDSTYRRLAITRKFLLPMAFAFLLLVQLILFMVVDGSFAVIVVVCWIKTKPRR